MRLDPGIDLHRPRLSASEIDQIAAGAVVREIQGRAWTVVAIVAGTADEDVAVLESSAGGEWRYRTATRDELSALFTPA